MKSNKKIFTYVLALLAISFYGCEPDDKDAQKRLELDSVGFSGTLPGKNNAFSSSGIVANSWPGISSDSENGAFVHIGLTVMDPISGTAIHLELPNVKYSNALAAQGVDTRSIAREYYPYNTVKEKLAVGNKLLTSEKDDPLRLRGFSLQVVNNKTHSEDDAFLMLQSGDQTGSYIKVTDLIEGTETDPVAGQIKTLEAIVDLDVKVQHASNASTAPERFKGVLRMKYRQY